MHGTSCVCRVYDLRCALAQNVYGHLDDPEHQDIQRGVSYLRLRPGAAARTLVLACLFRFDTAVLAGSLCAAVRAPAPAQTAWRCRMLRRRWRCCSLCPRGCRPRRCRRLFTATT